MHLPRVSIAAMMGFILVVCVALAGLQPGGETWAGVMLLLHGAILALALVGAACCRGACRAWWLGFFVFGAGYIFIADSATNPLPTTRILKAILVRRGIPPAGESIFIGLGSSPPGMQVGHYLWSLLAATLGGVLARWLFGSAEQSGGGPPPGGSRGRGWSRLAGLGLAAVVLIAVIGVVGPQSWPGLWAGSVLFLTWAVLGLAALGAAFGRGKRRAAWSGASLFGIGYMLLIFGTDPYEWSAARTIVENLVHDVRDFLPPIAWNTLDNPARIRMGNRRVLDALDEVVPLRFPDPTPLKDVLADLRERVQGPDGRPITIYVNPDGLTEAEKSMDSPVQFMLEGVPLRPGLKLLLRRLGLMYYVEDGLLVITSETSMDIPYAIEDPYVVSGHCLLSLLAALLGGLLGPLVAEPGERAALPGSEAVPATSPNSFPRNE